MFWITNILLASASISLLYSIYFHYDSGDYMKIVEPLAVLGPTLTVNENTTVSFWLATIFDFVRFLCLCFFHKEMHGKTTKN